MIAVYIAGGWIALSLIVTTIYGVLRARGNSKTGSRFDRYRTGGPLERRP